MTPSIESTSTSSTLPQKSARRAPTTAPPTTPATANDASTPAPGILAKDTPIVTFAVNYELPMVDQFMSPISTPHAQQQKHHHPQHTNTAGSAPAGSSSTDLHRVPERRVSARDRGKRPVSVSRLRMRYNMRLVPRVALARSASSSTKQGASSSGGSSARSHFYPEHAWWSPTARSRTDKSQAGKASRQRSSLRIRNDPPSSPSSESKRVLDPPSPKEPFPDSLVWIPTSRAAWEDCVAELTAVCAAAARATPVLSREYIRDRIDIDDPLTGFQWRCRAGGWLQGFCWYTTFTTWTRGFQWNSKHAQSGVLSDDASTAHLLDLDGSLADALEAEPRAGDPQSSGIVFETCAEIAMLGALGCGEALLRMTLDAIGAEGRYKYVVLQATEESKGFYERFGFIRVGAVCQYGTDDHAPLIGYRHWTHANESATSLQKHGGPSYMMCLALPEVKNTDFLKRMMRIQVDKKPTVEALGTHSTPYKATKLKHPEDVEKSAVTKPMEIAAPKRGRPRKNPVMEQQPVDKRPRGRPRKNPLLLPPNPVAPSESKGTTPKSSSRTREHQKKSPKATPEATPTATPKATSKRASKKRAPKKRAPKKRAPNAASTRELAKTKKRPASSSKSHSNHKRRRLELKPMELLKMSPPAGRPLSYAEKQYHSEWLAVPPSPTALTSRPPPRERSDSSNPSGRHPVRTAHPVPPGSSRLPVRNAASSGRQRKKTPKATTHPKRSKPAPTPSAKHSYLSTFTKHGPGTVVSIDKATLRKQKVRSYPRYDHFYNRVVQDSSGKRNYFCLEYDEDQNLLCLVPLQVNGVLSGRRAGRPRYQCVLGETNANFVVTGPQKYKLVRSAMIMKTPIVAQEAWDICTQNDVDFATR